MMALEEMQSQMVQEDEEDENQSVQVSSILLSEKII
jgi:hypothetical protein